jgi:hypothetical protein
MVSEIFQIEKNWLSYTNLQLHDKTPSFSLGQRSSKQALCSRAKPTTRLAANYYLI